MSEWRCLTEMADLSATTPSKSFRTSSSPTGSSLRKVDTTSTSTLFSDLRMAFEFYRAAALIEFVSALFSATQDPHNIETVAQEKDVASMRNRSRSTVLSRAVALTSKPQRTAFAKDCDASLVSPREVPGVRKLVLRSTNSTFRPMSPECYKSLTTIHSAIHRTASGG